MSRKPKLKSINDLVEQIGRLHLSMQEHQRELDAQKEQLAETCRALVADPSYQLVQALADGKPAPIQVQVSKPDLSIYQ